MRLKLISAVQNRDWTLTVRHIPWLFGKPYDVTYKGECTVWHEYPSGRRAGTSMEIALCDMWQRAVWEKEKSVKDA